jgi:hypothetical protein
MRIGPEAENLARSENGTLKSDLLEERIRALKDTVESNQRNKIDDSIKAEVQSIHESLLTIKTMILALAASQPEEIKSAIRHLNNRAQKHQMIVADLTGLDTPRLSNLQEKLREFQQREQTIPEAEKEKVSAEKEL